VNYRYGKHNLRGDRSLRVRVHALVVHEYIKGQSISQISESVSINKYYVRRFIGLAKRWAKHAALPGHWMTEDIRKEVAEL
jgi:hypothetical protein